MPGPPIQRLQTENHTLRVRVLILENAQLEHEETIRALLSQLEQRSTADPEDLEFIGEDSCPLCLEILTNPINLPCMHRMCSHCLRDWESAGLLNCPLCRQPMRPVSNPHTVPTIIENRRWTGYLVTNTPPGFEAMMGFHNVGWRRLALRLGLTAGRLRQSGYYLRHTEGLLAAQQLCIEYHIPCPPLHVPY